MTVVTESVAERPADRRGGVFGTGVLAGGLVALVVTQFLTTEPARASGLPVWVRVADAVLIVAGVGTVVVPRWRPGSPWTDSRRWRRALGIGGALLGTWAVVATVTDVRAGLPGLAIPSLAVGCVAVLAAAVLPAAPEPRHGSVARQALPAAVAAVLVAAVAVGVAVTGRWIPVDATTAERVDPGDVPNAPGGVRWTSTWQLRRLYENRFDPIKLVAAGAGMVVASDDRIVAIDGSTGAERWHYRQAGAWVASLDATPDGRTVMATYLAGNRGSSSTVFAFDANTGELRWSRSGQWGTAATEHVLITGSPDENITGVDIASGEELWTWTRPSTCDTNGHGEATLDAVLVPLICRDSGDARSYVLVGIDDRAGTERWRFAGPSVTWQYPLDAKLTTSPDRRVAVYTPGPEGSDAYADQVLLESATGTVRYRTGGAPEIAEPDARTPVLRREVPGGDDQLIVRDLSTGAERPLASTCPALRRSDPPSRKDAASTLVSPMVTAASVLVLCFDARSGATPRVTVDAYARSGGSALTTIAATDVAGPRDGPWDIQLVPAAGAIGLLVQNYHATPARITGLA